MRPFWVQKAVSVVTLDELIADSTFGRMDFVKMDIEGAERDALAGGEQTFRQFRPRLGITTYHHADDWRHLTAQLRPFAPDYRFHLKGVGLDQPGGWRPILLHGWTQKASASTKPFPAESQTKKGAA